MIESNGLNIGGIASYWRAARYTHRRELCDALDGLGLGGYAPDPRTSQAALKDALEEMYPSKTHRVEPLKRKDAFELVEVGRGELRNSWDHKLRVAVDKNNAIEVDPFDHGVAHRVADAFNSHLGLVRASGVTTALVNILLRHLNGTRLLESGSVYWLPPGSLKEWREIALAVEGVATRGRSNAVYLMRHHMGADEMRAVRDAITEEVMAEAGRLKDEVFNGTLGKRALEHRRAQADNLRWKIKHYEGLLEVGLGELREAVESTDEAASAAVLLAAGAAELAD